MRLDLVFVLLALPLRLSFFCFSLGLSVGFARRIPITLPVNPFAAALVPISVDPGVILLRLDPMSRDPHVPSARPTPVALHPNEVLSGRPRASLHARRGRGFDHDRRSRSRCASRA